MREHILPPPKEQAVQPLPPGPPSTTNGEAGMASDRAPAAVKNCSSYETVFTNAKAGMECVDRDRVRQVVYEMSKDSAHYQNEVRKMAATEERIKRMRTQASALTPAELDALATTVDKQISEMESSRDLTRTWIHVDMDAFFAAVEEQNNPDLRGRPFAVGGIGMISTANYAARKFGVRSAMPGFIALKLCPELIFVPCHFDKYKEASGLARTVFSHFDPNYHSWSLDEAALDVTDYCTLHGVTSAHVAEEIRARVQQVTGGLTCSCGVAPNRTLAKICSDVNKPNGQFIIQSTRQSVMDFVAPLPVRKVPGVGKVSEHVLKAFGIELCSDILPRKALLSALFSASSFEFFLQCALGLGPTCHPEAPAEGEVGRKGMSCERTFRSVSSRTDLEAKCQELAKQLSNDLIREGLKGKTLTLKLKLTTFEVRTRALTIGRYISHAVDIFDIALRLLRAELPVEVRLMGLRMSNFWEEPKRDPGQTSIVEILEGRTKKQKSEHSSNNEEGEHVAQHAGCMHDKIEVKEELEEEDDDEPHFSQVLSAAEELELTLQDWNAEPLPGVHEAPLPPHVATGAQLPATTLDRALRNDVHNELPIPQEHHLCSTESEQNQTGLCGSCSELASGSKGSWACVACTFENKKGTAWCDICGTSRSGWRPAQDLAAAGGGSGDRSRAQVPQKKKRTKRQMATGSNILEFCKPKNGSSL